MASEPKSTLKTGRVLAVLIERKLQGVLCTQKTLRCEGEGSEVRSGREKGLFFPSAGQTGQRRKQV